MSHIINPERRDPSAIKNKSELGLSRVDNVNSKDLIRSAFEYLKEEYWRGEKYSFTYEKSLFPLCKFTTDSTRLSVLIGFYRDSNALNLVSYVKADIVYDKNYTNQSSNEYGNGLLTISFEKSPNLSDSAALGEFILYKESSSNSNTAYLGFNFLGIASEYQLSICVNEYPIYGEGLVFSPSIELCDKTPRKKPNNSNIIESVSINSTDRTVSSISRSLAVYDNNGKLYHGKLTKAGGIPSGYTTPKINGTPFTGDGSYREIEITARHSGSDLNGAGYHKWEVLRNIPTVSFRRGKPNVTTYDADDVEDSKYGLCKLALVPSLSSGVDKNNLGSAISDLTSLVENSEISDSDVISSKFLKTYTKQLERIFQIISTFGGGGTEGEDITTTYYFHNNSTKDSDITSNPASNSISRLDLYPTASESIDYKILIQSRMKKMTLVCSDSEIKLDGGDWLYAASIDTQNNSSPSAQSQGYTRRASTFDMEEASTTTLNPSSVSTTKSPSGPPDPPEDDGTNTNPPTDDGGGSGSGGSGGSGSDSGEGDSSGSGSGGSSNPYPTDFKVNKFSLKLRSNLVYHRYTPGESQYLDGTIGITSDTEDAYGKIKVGVPFNSNSIFHKEYTSGNTDYEVVQPIVISRVGYSDQANSLPTNTITWISGYDFVTYDSSSNSGFIHSPSESEYSKAPTYELVLPPPEDSSVVTNKYLWVEGFSILNFKTEKSNLSEGIYIYRGNGTNTVISDEQNLLDSNTSLGYKDITKSNKSSSSLTAEQKNHRFLICIDLTKKRSYYVSNQEVIEPTDSDYEYHFNPNKNNHVIGNLVFKDCTTQTTNATIQLKYRQRALKLPVPSSDIVLNVCYEDISKAMDEASGLVGEPILTNIEGLSVVLSSGTNTKIPAAGGGLIGSISKACSRWSLELNLTSTRDFNFPITSESEWKEYESFNNKELSLFYTCPELPLYQQTPDGYKELDPLLPRTVKVPLKYRSTFSGGRSPLYFNKFTLSGITPTSVLLDFPTEGTSGQSAAEINFWEPSDFLYKEKHGYKNYPSQLLSEGSTVSKIPIARRTKIGDIQFTVLSVGKYYYDSSQNESSNVEVEYIIAPARRKIFIIYGLISDWGTIADTSAFITNPCYFSPQLGGLTDSNVEFNISSSSNNKFYSISTESMTQGCIPFKSCVKTKATAYSSAPADVKEDLAIITTISTKTSIQYTKEYIEFSLTSTGSDQPVYVSKDSDGAYTNKIRYDIYYVWWSRYTATSTGGVVADSSFQLQDDNKNGLASDWQNPSLDLNTGLTPGLSGTVPEVGTGVNKPGLGGFTKPGNVGLSSSY